MEDYDPRDIIATIKLKNGLIKIQDEFKTAIRTGEHLDVNLTSSDSYFYQRCEDIYHIKIKNLCWDIIEEHNKSDFNHINLLEYPKFKELLWNALFKTRDFLEKP